MNDRGDPNSAPRLDFRSARAWNIAFRTGHIGVTGVVLGGHVFDVAPERILIWLFLSIATGVILTAIEAYPRWIWFCQGRGVLVLGKLALLCLIPGMWDSRVAILAAVIVLASVGSHMPARFRYYSILHSQVVKH
jgi:hypothetical protein